MPCPRPDRFVTTKRRLTPWRLISILATIPPWPRPTLCLVILDHLKALHLRLAVPVASVVGFQIAQGRSGAVLEHVVAAITDDIQQPFSLAKLVDFRHRQPRVAAQHDEHVRPRRPQDLDDAAQRRDDATTGVDRPRT